MKCLLLVACCLLLVAGWVVQLLDDFRVLVTSFLLYLQDFNQQLVIMSYQNLDVYNKALTLFFKVHKISLKLPKFELYEQGSQIRRSADSVVSNIVEGYGRKCYKQEFIRFLIYALSSNDETINHLIKLKVLYPTLNNELKELESEYQILGAKLNNFIKYVQSNWRTDK